MVRLTPVPPPPEKKGEGVGGGKGAPPIAGLEVGGESEEGASDADCAGEAHAPPGFPKNPGPPLNDSKGPVNSSGERGDIALTFIAPSSVSSR
mmetsp:Transcript_318/g.921  ORF Transcript_318/g.921 Transcript_318/m.921 type:complete len:93 (-) Transcript_318:213-491(-)